MTTNLLNNQQAISLQINQYFAADDTDSAEKLLLSSIKKYPNEHLFFAQLSVVNYELGNDKNAIEYAKKSLEITPSCQLAQNYYAVALQATDKDTEAIKIWLSLLNRSIKDLAFNDCGEGVRNAKSLQNDIRFNLGVSYSALENSEKAKFYFNEHLKNRKQGQFSNFTRKDVAEYIEELS